MEAATTTTTRTNLVSHYHHQLVALTIYTRLWNCMKLPWTYCRVAPQCLLHRHHRLFWTWTNWSPWPVSTILDQFMNNYCGWVEVIIVNVECHNNKKNMRLQKYTPVWNGSWLCWKHVRTLPVRAEGAACHVETRMIIKKVALLEIIAWIVVKIMTMRASTTLFAAVASAMNIITTTAARATISGRFQATILYCNPFMPRPWHGK